MFGIKSSRKNEKPNTAPMEHFGKKLAPLDRDLPAPRIGHFFQSRKNDTRGRLLQGDTAPAHKGAVLFFRFGFEWTEAGFVDFPDGVFRCGDISRRGHTAIIPYFSRHEKEEKSDKHSEPRRNVHHREKGQQKNNQEQ